MRAIITNTNILFMDHIVRIEIMPHGANVYMVDGSMHCITSEAAGRLRNSLANTGAMVLS
jgi:hypothetical protein